MNIIACTSNVFNIGQDDRASIVVMFLNNKLSVVSVDGTEYDLEEINY